MSQVISRRRLLAGAGAIGAAALTGCSKAAATTASKTPAKVTILTNLGANGRDGYPWVAATKGYFTAAGLDVTVVPGNPATTSTALAGGQAQFGVIDFVNLAIQHGTALANPGNGPDLRALAAIQQSTLSSVVCLQRSGINRPTDLAGRLIAYPTGSVLGGQRSLFTAYAKIAGFDAGKVRWAPMASAELTPTLAAGRVDGVVQYLVGAPTVEAVAKQPTVTLAYSDYMRDLYGGVLVAPQHLINSEPDMVRRFVAALMKGLAYSVAHPDEAGQLLHQAVPTTQSASAAQELRLMGPYVTSAGTVGAMSAARVMRALSALMSDGLVPPALTPDAVARFDFTPKAAM